jgi:uncharacterized protein
MNKPVFHKVFNNPLWLSADRCIYWESQQALILSDLHFGKTGHFRKEGIAVPQKVYKEDLQRLFCQIQFFQPRKLIIVGDMFHSRANKEIELFKKWISDISWMDITLVKGNHDILQDDWYRDTGIEVINPSYTVDNFSFIHDIADSNERPADNYFFSGHMHPGISIRGMGKQSMQLPCFYFTATHCVLPAFSRFTGTYGVTPAKNESIFAIAENRILQLQ